MAYIYGKVVSAKLADGSADGEYQVRLGYQVNSQNIQNNTSNITLRLEVRSVKSSYATYGYNQTTTIDGTTLSSASFDMRSTNTWQVFGTRTITVTHNTAGKYSASKTGSFTTTATSTYSLKSGSASVTVAPPTIPRYATSVQSLSGKTINTININWSSDKTIDYIWYSKDGGGTWTAVGSVNAASGSYSISNLSPNTAYSIKTRVRSKDSQLTTDSSALSVTTYDYAKITEAPNIKIGQSATIKFSNPSGATIVVGIYKTDAQTAIVPYINVTPTATSYTFSLTQAQKNLIYSSIPNDSSIKLRYYLRTSANGTYYYSYSEKEFTVDAATSSPTFSNFTVQDIDSTTTTLTGNNLNFIRKYSDLKVTISSANKMVAKNSATAKSYNVIVGNISKSLGYSSSDINTTISNMDGNSVTVYAIDSRNNQTPVSKSLTIVNYTECIINSLRIDRVDGVGTNIKITMTGKYSTVNFGAVTNSIKNIDIRAKAKTSSTWGSWNSIKNLFSITGGNISGTNVVYSGITFTLGTEYDIEVRVVDELSTDTESASLTDGKVLWSAAKSLGVNFGGIYDASVGGPLQKNGKDVATKEDFTLTVYGNGQIDPNITLEPLILSKHTNTPDLNYFWYIRTMFYSSISTTSSRSQIAIGYTVNELWQRYYYQGSWTSWVKIPPKTAPTKNSGSLNDISENDICYANSSVTERPSGVGNGYCITLVLNNNYKKQFYCVQGANDTYERIFTIGTWSDWTKKVIQGLSHFESITAGKQGYVILGDLQIAWGDVSITPSAANTPTGKAITFTKAFKNNPTVITNAATSVPGTQVIGTGAANASTTGFTAYLTRTNTTATSIYWIAIGQKA